MFLSKKIKEQRLEYYYYDKTIFYKCKNSFFVTRIEYCHTQLLPQTIIFHHRNYFLSQGDYLVIERNFLSREKISWYKGKFLVTVGFHPVRTRPSPHSSIFRGEYFTIFQNRIFGKGFHSIVVLDRVSLFWWIFLNTFDIFDENPFLQIVTSEPTVPPLVEYPAHYQLLLHHPPCTPY